MNDALESEALARDMTWTAWIARMSEGLVQFYIEHSGDTLSYGLIFSDEPANDNGGKDG